MERLTKLVAIILFLVAVWNIIPEGKIELNYVNNNNLHQQLTLYRIAEEQKQKELEELMREMAKNYNLTLTMDLRTKCNLFASDYDYLLQGTELEGIGQALEQAETKYNINGLYLMGLCILESGWGTSDFAVYRNNLVGWNAIDSNPNQATTFESKEHCILYVAEKLQKNYLTEGGAYFEGYTAKDIDIHYCTDTEHANKIINIVNQLVEKI